MSDTSHRFVSMVEPEVEQTYTRADWRETHLLDHRTKQLLTMFCSKVLDADSVEQHPPAKDACVSCADRKKAYGR